MKLDALIKEMDGGKIHPIYFLHGDEAYYIDKFTEYAETKILSDEEKAFNQIVLYGKDADLKSIIDEARQYPMMASKRLIILKEAQQMDALTELLPYIENPVPTTVLVICYKYNKLDKRTKFAKVIEQKSVVLESKKLYDNQVAGWIRDYLVEHKFKSESGVAEILLEYVGADLSKLSNEIDKLMLNATKERHISISDVKEQIGISKDFDVFELQRMLGEKNFIKASLIIRYFADNPKSNPVVMIVPSLYNYFNKVYTAKYYEKSNDQELSKLLGVIPFFVKEYRIAAKNYTKVHLIKIFQTLKEADQASKGVGVRRVENGSIFKDVLIACMQA